MKSKIERTGRGFELIEFYDASGAKCSLQQSSAVGYYKDSSSRPGTSFVWLGMNDVGTRMHLNREMVGELIEQLSNWLGTGSFSGVQNEEWPELADKAIKNLLDAHEALDREALARALHGLKILVGR